MGCGAVLRKVPIYTTTGASKPYGVGAGALCGHVPRVVQEGVDVLCMGGRRSRSRGGWAKLRKLGAEAPMCAQAAWSVRRRRRWPRDRQRAGPRTAEAPHMGLIPRASPLQSRACAPIGVESLESSSGPGLRSPHGWEMAGHPRLRVLVPSALCCRCCPSRLCEKTGLNQGHFDSPRGTDSDGESNLLNLLEY